jgi:di/tricarboxylate transporter
MVPIALSAAEQAGVAKMPLVMAVALGASTCFANPIGYQTNLLVLGPGGYRFRHFVKVGLPVDLLLITTAVLMIPWIWPL